ncbi:hypothetical protein K4F52_010322 [Lecanicillium sp. MT-2017a]|nr:hypothetical protein K4F52_010322 [Lecanicillium sp. MT-2017a]
MRRVASWTNTSRLPYHSDEFIRKCDGRTHTSDAGTAFVTENAVEHPKDDNQVTPFGFQTPQAIQPHEAGKIGVSGPALIERLEQLALERRAAADDPCFVDSTSEHESRPTSYGGKTPVGLTRRTKSTIKSVFEEIFEYFPVSDAADERENNPESTACRSMKSDEAAREKTNLQPASR